MRMNPKGEWQEDASALPFLACSFFTDAYRVNVERLHASLVHTQTPYFLKRYPSRGYWEANTRIKPEFLLACLERFPGRDIVYLDADSVVHAPLELFFRFEGDVGVFVAPADSGLSHRYLTGTLYLRNTPAVHRFVRHWIDAQGGMVLGVDQDSFSVAVRRNPALAITPLPESYVKIFDRGSETPVVEHFQASRQRVKLQRTMKKTRNVVLGVVFVAALAWLITTWL